MTFTVYHDIAGWSTLFALSCLIAMGLFARQVVREFRRIAAIAPVSGRVLEILCRRDGLRLIAGGCLFLAGAWLIVGARIPLRGFELAKAWSVYIWWNGVAGMMGSFGALLAVWGLSIIFWPLLMRVAGGRAQQAAFLVAGYILFAYALGVGLCEAFYRVAAS